MVHQKPYLPSVCLAKITLNLHNCRAPGDTKQRPEPLRSMLPIDDKRYTKNYKTRKREQKAANKNQTEPPQHRTGSNSFWKDFQGEMGFGRRLRGWIRTQHANKVGMEKYEQGHKGMCRKCQVVPWGWNIGKRRRIEEEDEGMLCMALHITWIPLRSLNLNLYWVTSMDSGTVLSF